MAVASSLGDSCAYEEARSYLRREMKKIWEGSNLRAMIMDYLQFRRRNGGAAALNDFSFDYVLRIVEFLISLRFFLRDEGMCAYQYEGTDMALTRSLRLRFRSDEQREMDSSTFLRNSDCYRNPWSSLGYPKSNVSRDGRLTKHISVQQASDVLFGSGIVFKIFDVPKNPRGQSADLEEFHAVAVETIYEKRGKDKADSLRSRSMWRSCPNENILEVIENFLRNQRRRFGL